MDCLLDRRGDLLFTFQSQFIARVRGKAIKGSIGDADKLTKFYGDNRWKKCKNPEELVLAYISRLNQRRGIVLPIHVQGPRGYRIMFYMQLRKPKRGAHG